MDTSVLRANLARLSPRDQQFAQSLLSSRRLSDKQLFWVGELTKRATQPPPAKVKVAADLSPVLDLFRKAGQKLKHPAVVLSTPETGTVRLSVAGDRSKHPGTINVTTMGSFEDREWLGRVHLDGSYEPSRKAEAQAVGKLLSRFAASPAEVAAEHGKTTGACCFCNRALDDQRSVAVGYGPVCAANYSLPWGQ